MVARYYFYNEDWESHNDLDWDDTPAELWDDVTGGAGWDDEYGKMLFDMVFVDPVDGETRAVALNALQDWFDDEYDLDFGAEFDWEGWREWYG